MNARAVFTASLLFSLVAPAALAQAITDCPALPLGTSLHWELSGTSSMVICKAVNPQGAQAFGVMLTGKKPEKPAGARDEKGEIDGHKVHWYRSQIANRPDAQTRMAAVELGDDRYAQIWIDAPSEAALRTAIDAVQGLRFSGVQPVADNRGNR